MTPVEMILSEMDRAYTETGLDARNASAHDLRASVFNAFGVSVSFVDVAEAKDCWGTMDADLEDPR